MNLWDYAVPQSGITYESDEITWIKASAWANINYYDFRQQTPRFQSKIVAAYICDATAESVKANEDRKKNKGKGQ